LVTAAPVTKIGADVVVGGEEAVVLTMTGTVVKTGEEAAVTTTTEEVLKYCVKDW
jgi:hypothetical protein